MSGTYKEVVAVVEEARRQAKATGYSPEWIVATSLVKAFPGTSMGFIRQQPVASTAEPKKRPAPLGVEIETK